MDNLYITPLISPQKLKTELPATISQKQFIEQTRNQIRQILNGIDSRLLLILGPCSIHDIGAAKHYATLLQELIQEVDNEFFVIMRTYFEKPRTSLGWKGLIYDPMLNGSNDINTGLKWSRKLLLELAQLHIPTATEILDPSTYFYFNDLISWGCIGARTASSQIHRQIASGFNLPIAFKNNPEGNIEVAINGVLTASESHSYIGINEEGLISSFKSQGNPDCHIVLRGGEYQPNYDSDSINHAIALLKRAKLPLRLLIDCSHDNSKRNYRKQIEVFENVLSQIFSGNQYIRGIILESNLDAGHQILDTTPFQLKYGISITDPCLDWTSTAAMVRKAYQTLKETKNERSKVHYNNSQEALF
jgi:3-deoxy-7-phosphoheptulonate synthase